MSAPDNADAELIALCDRFTEIEAHEKAQYVEIKNDDERDRAREPLDAERKMIKQRLYEIPDPTTLAGARAMARAAMASAPCDCGGGNPYFEGGVTEELFAFGAVQFLAAYRPCRPFRRHRVASSRRWRSSEVTPVPAELEMLRLLPTMRPGGAICWMAAAMLVVSGNSTPDDAYAGWIRQMTAAAAAESLCDDIARAPA